jgi:two-component system chemotaxis response regulator CheB
MKKLRVLIVDDAVVVRRLVADVIAGDPDLEVAGTAANGRIALARIAQLQPDLVTLDLEMPELDGLATLAAMRKAHPDLPVIMLSRFAQRCASATLEALTLGAVDYVTLPESGGSAATLETLREHLLPRLREIGTGHRRHGAKTSVLARSRTSELGVTRPRVDVVAIGTSTGGPNALAALVPLLPRLLPVPVLIVQHMPAGFTKQLAGRLSSLSALPVGEAVRGAVLEPGAVWIAPGDYHLEVGRDGAVPVLRTNRGPVVNSCRPSVDVLFRSAAQVYGAGVLGVLLTGMGQDGLLGCEQIKQAGGKVIAQDEASSVVWGMPGAVTRAGLADQVLPLDQIANDIVRRLRHGRSVSALDLRPLPAPSGG